MTKLVVLGIAEVDVDRDRHRGDITLACARLELLQCTCHAATATDIPKSSQVKDLDILSRLAHEEDIVQQGGDAQRNRVDAIGDAFGLMGVRVSEMLQTLLYSNIEHARRDDEIAPGLEHVLE